jgi:hypothetical protein
MSLVRRENPKNRDRTVGTSVMTALTSMILRQRMIAWTCVYSVPPGAGGSRPGVTAGCPRAPRRPARLAGRGWSAVPRQPSLASLPWAVSFAVSARPECLQRHRHVVHVRAGLRLHHGQHWTLRLLPARARRRAEQRGAARQRQGSRRCRLMTGRRVHAGPGNKRRQPGHRTTPGPGPTRCGPEHPAHKRPDIAALRLRVEQRPR